MRFSGLRRLWLVVATLSLLAGPAFASSALSFVCEGDLVARPECCCPGGHGAAASARDAASVSAACCCRVARVDARTVPATAAPRVAAQGNAKVALAPATLPTVGSFVPSVRGWPAIRFAHPPPPAVPILLVKQSFLV